MKLLIQNIAEFILIHWKILFILLVFLNILINIDIFIRIRKLCLCFGNPNPEIRNKQLRKFYIVIAMHIIILILSIFTLLFMPIYFCFKVLTIFIIEALWFAMILISNKIF